MTAFIRLSEMHSETSFTYKSPRIDINFVLAKLMPKAGHESSGGVPHRAISSARGYRASATPENVTHASQIIVLAVWAFYFFWLASGSVRCPLFDVVHRFMREGESEAFSTSFVSTFQMPHLSTYHKISIIFLGSWLQVILWCIRNNSPGNELAIGYKRVR